MCSAAGKAFAGFQRVEPSQALPRQIPLLSPAVTSSPGAGEVFPQRESQAVMFVAKVLGITRKLPAVLLPLPLGEVAPQVTERAHAVSLIAKVFKCNEKPCSRCRCARNRPGEAITRTVDWKNKGLQLPPSRGKIGA